MLRRWFEGTWSLLQNHSSRGDVGHMTARYYHLHRLPLRLVSPLTSSDQIGLQVTHTEQEESRSIPCGIQRKELCVDVAPEDPHQHFKTWWGGDWKLLWASIHTILPLLCPPKKGSPVKHPSLSRSYLYPVVGGFTSFAEFQSDITQICHHRWSHR